MVGYIELQDGLCVKKKIKKILSLLVSDLQLENQYLVVKKLFNCLGDPVPHHLNFWKTT